MDAPEGNDDNIFYDRALLLHGAKRNEVLTLEEVRQYGVDSFSDAEYTRIYGMPPTEWYGRGIRLLGRTVVECTRDALGDLIGRDIAALAATMPSTSAFVVIDPFAGSCNTLYWILRHVANAEGIAFELDPQVYALSKRNILALDRKIELVQGDYRTLLESRRVPGDRGVIVFVAPPWGTALDEDAGLDLRRTTPPITDVVTRIGRTYAAQRLLFATQVYEKVNPDSLADLRAMADWSQPRIYRLNDEGRNHGILLVAKGWKP